MSYKDPSVEAIHSPAKRLEAELHALKTSFTDAIQKPRSRGLTRGNPVVVFRLDQSFFALPADEISEVIASTHLITVPHSFPHLAGAIGHRQEVYEVINPGHQLNIPLKEKAWILIARSKSHRWGIIIDEFLGVKETTAETNISGGDEKIDDKVVAIISTRDFALEEEF